MLEVIDYAPPKHPSLDQQRDALQKGLGRAMQWALSGKLSDEPLLEACLSDKRHDKQCEDLRGAWLWNIMQAVNAANRFRVPILHALYGLSDESSAGQHCQLAYHYAKAGDDAFRRRLYEIVEQKPYPDYALLGEEEVIQLDGEQAFLFVSQIRGKRLETIAWDWDDECMVNFAIEQIGEPRVSELLSSSADASIRRFSENWHKRRSRQSTGNGKDAYQDRMRAISVDAVIQATKSDESCQWFRGWGINADEESLQAILDVLWETTEPDMIAKLLIVFWHRKLPNFDARLIDLCRSEQEEVKRAAFNALKRNSHVAIHDFALEQLAKEATHFVVSLFVENFENGDEGRILEAITLPDDPCELHWLLMEVIDVLENNPEADCLSLGLISYGDNPCEMCRYPAAQLLYQNGAAPTWLIEECRYDSYDECRTLPETRASH